MSSAVPRPVPPGESPPLGDEEAARPSRLPEGEALDGELAELRERLGELGGALRAEKRRALLVALQPRDTGGKDGVVEKVFGAVLPQHLRVQAFQQPSDEERAHDFLWRVHAAVPPYGTAGVFNRSRYEDVVTARVHEHVPEEVWSPALPPGQRLRADAGRERRHAGQAVPARLPRRAEAAVAEAAGGAEQAVGVRSQRPPRAGAVGRVHRGVPDAIARCGTEWAPWHVIPADDKAVRNRLVARIVVDALERMDPRFPDPAYDVQESRRQLEQL